MITHQVTPDTRSSPATGLRYALLPVHGYGIAVATVARMLDRDGTGVTARILQPNEAVPQGAEPVLLAESTVYGAVCVEKMLRSWHPQVPRPWLVLVADAPARPARAARYRFRALGARLAGTALVPYMPSLRAVEGPETALQFNDVKKAADALRRHIEGKK